jgi:hypothetical protein
MADPKILERLRTYGSDVSRWPDLTSEARAALLSDRDLRAAYERERALDRDLAEEGCALDREISGAGALDRVRRRALSRVSTNALAGMPWRRLAAAMLVAGMLGGAVDLMLPTQADDPLEAVLGEPLYDLAGAELQ